MNLQEIKESIIKNAIKREIPICKRGSNAIQIATSRSEFATLRMMYNNHPYLYFNKLISNYDMRDSFDDKMMKDRGYYMNDGNCYNDTFIVGCDSKIHLLGKYSRGMIFDNCTVYVDAEYVSIKAYGNSKIVINKPCTVLLHDKAQVISNENNFECNIEYLGDSPDKYEVLVDAESWKPWHI